MYSLMSLVNADVIFLIKLPDSLILVKLDFSFEIKTNAVFTFVYPFAVDITLYRNGYHGDLNETFFVGDVDEGARKLVQTTYECLMQAIDAGQAQCWAPLELLSAVGLHVPPLPRACLVPPAAPLPCLSWPGVWQ